MKITISDGRKADWWFRLRVTAGQPAIDKYKWIQALDTLRFLNPDLYKSVMAAHLCDEPNQYHSEYLGLKYPKENPDESV